VKMRKMKIKPKGLPVDTDTCLDSICAKKSYFGRMENGYLHVLDPSTGKPMKFGLYVWVVWRWK